MTFFAPWAKLRIQAEISRSLGFLGLALLAGFRASPALFVHCLGEKRGKRGCLLHFPQVSQGPRFIRV